MKYCIKCGSNIIRPDDSVTYEGFSVCGVCLNEFVKLRAPDKETKNWKVSDKKKFLQSFMREFQAACYLDMKKKLSMNTRTIQVTRDLEVRNELIPYVKDIHEHLKNYTKGQDELLERISELIYQSELQKYSQRSYRPQTLLIVGGSGTGKTSSIDALEEFYPKSSGHHEFNKKIIKVDCSSLSPASYKGNRLDMIGKLALEAYGGDLEDLVDIGCVFFFDEFDKLFHTGLETKQGVVRELLKLMEGSIAFESDQLKGQYQEIDLTNSIFIFSGAFSYIESSINSKSMGLNKSHSLEDKKVVKKNDLLKFGIPTEIIGRFNYFVTTNPLSKETIRKIMTTSQNSQWLELEEEVRFHGIKEMDLSYELERIVSECASNPLGLRVANQMIATLRSRIFKDYVLEDKKCPLKTV
ncbi:MAG: AAA domain-containing protein [Oligoflexia bacterium]|nr:AAA domain-containing protein [Oligoflexia bacterium]